MRQASISQHLMVLRKAGLISPQREGRNIFYRLSRPDVVDVLRQAAGLTGVSPEMLDELGRRPVEGCPCPQCNPGMHPEQTCNKMRLDAKKK